MFWRGFSVGSARANCENLEERKRAVTRLAPRIRTGVFRKQFLKRAVLRLPQLDLVWKEIHSSLTLKSAEEAAPTFLPRRSSKLVIVESVRLRKNGWKRVYSKSTRWLGMSWHFEVSKDHRSSPPTVGVFLCLDDGPTTGLEPSIGIEIDIFVKEWPNRTWKQVLKPPRVVDGAFFAEIRGTGCADVLGLPWDQAVRAKEYLDPSGCVCFRVEAQQVKDAPSG